MMKKLTLLAAALMFVSASFAQFTSKRTNSVVRSNDSESLIWYQGEVSIGFATGSKLSYTDSDGDSGIETTDFSRPLIETVHGVRITKYGFIGLGMGFQYAYGNQANEFVDNKWNTLLMPFFVNIKGYYPLSGGWSPYITLSVGGSSVLTSAWNRTSGDDEYRLKGGLYSKLGIGVNYKRCFLDFGLMHQTFRYEELDGGYLDYWSKEKFNSFYFNIGYKF